MAIKMSFEQICPFVRYAQFLTVSSNKQYVNLVSYDYRLFYCRDGSGLISVDGVLYEMSEGTLMIWPPGHRYSLLVGKNSTSLELMGVSFDYTRNCENKSVPIPPAKWRNYDPTQVVEIVEFTDITELNEPVFKNDMQFLTGAMYNLVSDFIWKKNCYKLRVTGLLMSNLSLVARLSINQKNARRSEMMTDKVIQYIHAHYKEDITNKKLGEIFGYHPNHLNRLIVLNTGMSIHQYLISCRIDAAIELIQTSDIKTSEIAEAVGFRDTTHFLKYFKKKTGKTTKSFRK